MLRAELYAGLDRRSLDMLVCEKKDLKKALSRISRETDPEKETLIIQVCEKQYKIYCTAKSMSAKNISVQLDPALRFRMEIDIHELEAAMERVNAAALEYPFQALADKYCLVRYLDLNDDFMILDVYVKMEGQENIIPL